MRAVRTFLISTALLWPLAALVHGDDDKPAYVAEQGEDVGDCTLPIRPCRTIEYAQSVVGKSGRIRVAAGTYALEDTEKIFNLTSGVIDIRGGYNRFDHFLQQAPDANKTSIVGVPARYRDSLRDRGFHVISDIKSIDFGKQQALARMHASYDATLVSSASTECSNGSAGAYACEKIDLLSHMALRDFGLRPRGGNDIWGFIDLNTEREYALVGLYNGVSIVDVTAPESPHEVGFVRGIGTDWRDLKNLQVYDAEADRWKAYAYASGESFAHLLVIDLTGLPNQVSLGHRLLEASIHNLYVSNVDYASGVPLEDTQALLHSLGQQRSGGKFLSFELTDPLDPKLKASSTSGYSHDATSMWITDARASGCTAGGASCEVLIDFNENTFDLWDFSDQANPRMLSSSTYSGASYIHSGWWTEDGQYLFVHDELDEYYFGLKTTLRVFDISDLASPTSVGTWRGPTSAIDHNGYVRGNRYYMSNYTRGLTILDISDPGSPKDVGHFDTYPASDSGSFVGAWGVYPYLPSGNVLVSDMNTGLYVVREHTRQSEAGKLGFASAVQGGVEGQTVSVSVQRSDGSEGDVSVDYSVISGSADSSDVTLSTGNLEWSSGDSSARSISIPLLSDSSAESIERAFVRLTNPSGGAVLGEVNLASVFVADVGSSAGLAFSQPELMVDEGAGRVIVTVQRTGTPLGGVSANLEVYAGTALADSDYSTPTDSQLTWADGDATSRTVVIDLIQDDVEESAETFGVRLVSVTGASGPSKDMQVTIGSESGNAVTDILLYDNLIAQDTRTMVDGIRLHEAGVAAERFNFRALVRDKDVVQSLSIQLSGAVTAERTISGSSGGLPTGPLLLFAPADQGDTQLTEGDYQITVTPYSGTDLSGDVGTAMSIEFAVGDSEPTIVAPSDASLSALAIGDLELAFDSETLTYAVSVANDVSSVTVSATATHDSASVRISPTDASDSVDGHQVALDVGSNVISVTVTAEDGSTTTSYRVTVVRAEEEVAELSQDANLSSLSLSGARFAFDSETTDYSVTFDQFSAVVTVTATTSHENASLEIRPTDAIAALDGHQVVLVPGINQITVTVTAEDGTTSKTYILNVYRQPSFQIFDGNDP